MRPEDLDEIKGLCRVILAEEDPTISHHLLVQLLELLERERLDFAPDNDKTAN